MSTETYICIQPNDGDVGAGDDWSSSSPFPGYTNSSNGFLLSNVRGASKSGYTLIPNTLIDIGEVQRSIDMFSRLSKKGGELVIQGLGGVAKINDFDFTIQAVATTYPLMLLGRRCIIEIGVYEVFRGRIYNITPSSYEITFTVRGNFTLWDKEIGTITEFDSEETKDKIYPICYGDFTDDSVRVPMLYDKDIRYIPKLYLGEENYVSINDFYCWDKIQMQWVKAVNTPSDLNIQTGNKEIHLKKSKATLFGAINSSQTSINIDTTSKIATTLSGVSTAPSVGDVYTWTDGVDTFYHRLESIEDGVYTWYSSWPIDIDTSATLTRVSGSGDATLTMTVASQLIEPDFWPVMTGETAANFTMNDVNTNGPLNAIPTPKRIVIDDEEMLVYHSYSSVTSVYAVTVAHVLRGYNNTDAASHADDAEVYVLNENVKEDKWQIEMFLPVTEIAQYQDPSFINTAATFSMVDVDGYNNILTQEYDTPFYVKITTNHVNASTKRVGILNLDFRFSKTDLKGIITDIFLQGRYETVAADTDADRYAINLSSGGQEDAENVFIGFNRLIAEKYAYITDGRIPTDLTIEDIPLGQIFDSSASITSFDSENDRYGISLQGSWLYSSPNSTYFRFTENGEIVGVMDAKDLEGKRYIIGLLAQTAAGAGSNESFAVNIYDPGILVQMYVDPVQYPFYAAAKTRKYSTDSNMTDILDLDYLDREDTAITDALYCADWYSTAFFAGGEDGLFAYSYGSDILTQEDAVTAYAIYDIQAYYYSQIEMCVATGTYGVRIFSYISAALSLEYYNNSFSATGTTNVLAVAQAETRIFVLNKTSGTSIYMISFDMSLTEQDDVNWTTTADTPLDICASNVDTNDNFILVCVAGDLHSYSYNSSTDAFTLEESDILSGVTAVAACPNNSAIYYIAYTDANGRNYLAVATMSGSAGSREITLGKTIVTSGPVTDLRVSDDRLTASCGQYGCDIFVADEDDVFFMDNFKYDASDKTLGYTTFYSGILAKTASGAPNTYRLFAVASDSYRGEYLGCYLAEGRYYKASQDVTIKSPVSIIEDLALKELDITPTSIANFNQTNKICSAQQARFIYDKSPTNFSRVVKDLCENHNLLVMENYAGNFTVKSLAYPYDDVTIKTIYNSDINMEGNIPAYKEKYTKIDDIITSLTVRYNYREQDKKYLNTLNADTILADSLSDAKDTIDTDRAAVLDLNTCYDERTARAICDTVAMYTTKPLRVLTLTCNLGVLGIDLCDWCEFENDTYIKGTDNHIYLVIEMSIQPGYLDTYPEATVELVEIDRR